MLREDSLIVLAPMEGVLDFYLRDIMTAIGGYDFCVTEFIRVTDKLLPLKVLRRYCPEIDMGFKTRHGTPVIVQFLGGQPHPLAENAAQAAEAGAQHIDLNFGCPAPTVNRHDGGATLLKFPERVFAIVSTVRNALPESITLSAKMRLGYQNTDLALENARAVEAAGAQRLTVHARTKMQAYQPPAYWEWIEKIRGAIGIPVIANGEIWSAADAHRCMQITGCHSLMLGRGAIAQPDLGLAIRSPSHHLLTDREKASLVERFVTSASLEVSPEFALARCKQWLRLLGRNSPELQELFFVVRQLRQLDIAIKHIRESISSKDLSRGENLYNQVLPVLCSSEANAAK